MGVLRRPCGPVRCLDLTAAVLTSLMVKSRPFGRSLGSGDRDEPSPGF
jgi:hypothetical protein